MKNGATVANRKKMHVTYDHFHATGCTSGRAACLLFVTIFGHSACTIKFNISFNKTGQDSVESP
jgi:hypothetical protein